MTRGLQIFILFFDFTKLSAQYLRPDLVLSKEVFLKLYLSGKLCIFKIKNLAHSTNKHLSQ